MANVFERVDSWIIENIFQPLTDTIEEKTHINNFKLTRIILCAVIAYGAVQYVGVGNYAGAALYGIIGVVYVYWSLMFESSSRKKGLNVSRTGPAWVSIRILSLIGVVFTFIELTTSFKLFSSFVLLQPISITDRMITTTGIFLALYSLACSGLPPFKKSAKKLVGATS